MKWIFVVYVFACIEIPFYKSNVQILTLHVLFSFNGHGTARAVAAAGSASPSHCCQLVEE